MNLCILFFVFIYFKFNYKEYYNKRVKKIENIFILYLINNLKLLILNKNHKS